MSNSRGGGRKWRRPAGRHDEELDEQEALFVAAWTNGMTGPEKQRRGEGLPWDAPGFESHSSRRVHH
jgi:hypothetical protein